LHSYIYFAMAFSVLVEVLSLKSRKSAAVCDGARIAED
jgi:hypothetical protein